MPGKSKKGPGAFTLHGQSKAKGAATHIVVIGNLRVMITHDDGSWFAQALEIDYAAQGTSLQDVKTRFEKGLAATIHEHLKIFGSINKLLQPAPPDVWVQLVQAVKTAKVYSQLSFHLLPLELPFGKIEYFEEEPSYAVHA